MNTNKNSYTLIYSIVMVVVVAFLLSFVSSALKERQTANVELDKKKQILNALQIDWAGQDAGALFDKYIVNGLVINSDAKVLKESKDATFNIEITKEMSKPLEQRELPVFVADVDGETKYIVNLAGSGLWGALWGYLALDSDRNTIYGAYFSHASETPGLGANIAEKPFQEQFKGKHILNSANEFVSVAVMKAGTRADGMEQVDGISGGTITSKGVETMLYNSLVQYDKFFQQTTEGGNN
ncbi:NADH:ubiquinone reductase (Na(+)-transporting) subunit C [Paludibacter sp. 221]|uniref:NADH:ubiquinone reductase (Na(+)-transporting) subunit C n=1 Tax=Paludibacter sp. 221 TaxID=2302939 RepID=UPI0013D88175|nr:NADH:ubiquinone reductase (Na(+)-transporting) subunit C [Paludibacter sp. 221]NDV45642.1 NADH:ubiquinone reductase (Na(+)-transporting) subunit C [Paludibacter sp. 221]